MCAGRVGIGQKRGGSPSHTVNRPPLTGNDGTSASLKKCRGSRSHASDREPRSAATRVSSEPRRGQEKTDKMPSVCPQLGSVRYALIQSLAYVPTAGRLSPIGRRPSHRAHRKREARLGVIGLGYVGLASGRRARPGGISRSRSGRGRQRVAELAAGRSYIQDVPASTVRALVRSKRLVPGTDFRVLRELDAVNVCVPTPLSKQKDPDVSFIVAASREVAKYLHRGMLVDSREHHLPRHDARTDPAHARGDRPHGWPGLLPGVFSGTRGSGESTLQHAQHPQGGGRCDTHVHRSRRASLPPAAGARGPGLLSRGGGDGQAPREHLPQREHRNGERDGTPLRATRHRCVGGDRRRGHQAVRLHALLSRAWSRWALHPDRPLLPVMEGTRQRVRGAFHRAGRTRERAHAGARRGPRGAQPQCQRAGRARSSNPGAGRGLQGQHR